MDTKSIEYSAILYGYSPSKDYFIRHILNALREHKELLDSPDYKRLYDEVLDYLFRYAVKECSWDKNKREEAYNWFEFLSDFDNKTAEKHGLEKYSIEVVDAFLAERRKIWTI